MTTGGAATTSRGVRRWRRGAVTAAVVLAAILALQLIGVPTLVLAFAILPVFVYVPLALWLDRYEPEPWWLLAGTFLWGASVAVLVAGIVNSTGSQLISAELGAGAGDAYGASVSAPFIEEIMKGLALLAVLLWRRHELNGFLDAIVYASMVGLGFAMTENVQYYGKALEAGTGALGQNFFLRGVLLPFLHPLFTSMTGIGLVLALRAKDRRTKILAIALGLGAAMLLHSAWNTNPVVFGPLLALPAFVLMLILIRRSLRHEAAVIRRYLSDGTASAEDIEGLASMRARFADATRALKEGGFRRWAERSAHLSALGDLAFSRYRAANPPTQDAPVGFRGLLTELRREWREPTTS
jgi:RsiW-degrading membrane proteinase PrsW (M82 family)